MSGSPSSTRLLKCDGCQAMLPYGPEHVGRKCRCGRCGKMLVVPAPPSVVPAGRPAESKIDYVEFWCRVCDTRLVALATDSGKRAKCTDCGAVNQVPPFKAKTAPRTPPAMEEPQYELWEVDEAPDPQVLRARQPKLLPVYCRVCDTLMYARSEQIGDQLKCPDCGGLTVVKKPPQEAEKKSVLVPAGEEYQLDPAEHLAPAAIPEYVERLKRESRLRVELEAERKAAERPRMPRFPTFVGVWPMLFSEPIPVWWVALSAGGMGVMFFAIEGAATQIAGVQAIYAMLCTTLAVFLGAFWFGPLASLSCAIVAESSDGLKKLHSHPNIFVVNCFPEIAHIICPLSLSLAPGLGLMKFTTWQTWAPVAALSWLILFPVMLLSTLQQNNPMGIYSPALWSSVVLRPAHWLLFYIQAAVIIAVTGATILRIVHAAPEWILITVPVGLAGWFVYLRVLGRFAWWLAESLPADETPQPEPRYKRY